LDVPIRPLLQIEFGPSFDADDVAALTTAFEAALKKLSLIDRNDPMALTVAKAVIQLAKEGERDPDKLCNAALKMLGE
jgi:hypothetical protein